MQVQHTLIARQQPIPLVGDEHFPDGCVRLEFTGNPNVSYSEVHALIDQLNEIARGMRQG